MESKRKILRSGGINFTYEQLLGSYQFIESRSKVSDFSNSQRSLFRLLAKVCWFSVRAALSKTIPPREILYLSFRGLRQDTPPNFQLHGNVLFINKLSIRIFDVFTIYYCVISFFIRETIKGKTINPRLLCSLIIAVIWLVAVDRLCSRKVHFYYYGFLDEVAAFLYLLKTNANVEVYYYEFASFLNESLKVSSDVIFYPYDITSNYAEKNSSVASGTSYLAHRNVGDLRTEAGKRIKIIDQGRQQRIGIYSSAYYRRDPRDFRDKEFLKVGCTHEDNLMKMVECYAKSRKHIEFVIYIHGNYLEPRQIAQSHYSHLLSLSNVKLVPKGRKSKDEFQSVDLGITVNSNVFWNRLGLGLKTILFGSFQFHHFINNSQIRAVSIKNPWDGDMSTLDYFLNMSEETFIDLLEKDG